MDEHHANERVRIARQQRGALVSVSVARPGLREFHMTAVPPASARGDDATAQTREVYEALVSWLREQKAVGVQERIFGSLSRREAILAAREAVVRDDPGRGLWAPTFLEGAPCAGEGLAGVHVYAVAGPSCRPVCHAGRCFGATFEHRGTHHVHLSGIEGPAAAGGRREAAAAMFARADETLRGLGGSYADVVRTWVYLADILDWYDQFNEARSAFHSRVYAAGPSGPRWLPASTGIGCRPPGGAHCIMDLAALGGAGRANVRVEALHNPLQSEAYSYGSDFSRGVSVAFEGAETVYVSGTAAIDQEGRSVCTGDLGGQVHRTLDNIASLLSTRGMTLDDVASSTVFIKEGQDANVVRTLIEERGGGLAHGVYLTADVCRPELLFEADGVAVRVTR
jgi:enamine deaminase RidA (YjgF/YER057c/UK114 family)